MQALSLALLKDSKTRAGKQVSKKPATEMAAESTGVSTSCMRVERDKNILEKLTQLQMSRSETISRGERKRQ